MTTLAVTIGIGEVHAGYAAAAAGWVERYLGLETFVIGDEHLPLALDVERMAERVWSLKFRIFDVIPSHFDRVMYFDCDWRPVRPWDVDALFPDRDAIYAVPDLSYKAITQRLESTYELAPGTYFNSGWMILPRTAASLLEQARREYSTLEKAAFGDQCVLNQVMAGRVTLVSDAFNVLGPFQWPDPAHVMAVHNKQNYALYRGEQADRQWEFPSYPDPNETILRALDYRHNWFTDAEHIVEVYQVAKEYAGGRALEIGSFRGHSTLALALAGLDVTSYDFDRKTAHVREGLLKRYGQPVHFLNKDGFHELDRPGSYDVVMQDADHGDHIRLELEVFWDLKVKPVGMLIVHDVNLLNLAALVAAISPEAALVTVDGRGRQMAYFRKQDGARGA